MTRDLSFDESVMRDGGKKILGYRMCGPRIVKHRKSLGPRLVTRFIHDVAKHFWQSRIRVLIVAGSHSHHCHVRMPVATLSADAVELEIVPLAEKSTALMFSASG